jgi:SAM-dependent methyltransferase
LYATHAIGGRRLEVDEVPERALFAFVESPAECDVFDSPRRARVSGWVASPRGRECRVFATVGGCERHELPITIERPDVPPSLGFSVEESGSLLGFDHTFEIPDDDPVMVTVQFTDGDVMGTSDTFLFHRGPPPPPPAYRLPSAASRVAAAGATPARAEYQRVWDTVAKEEDTAKVAVAGYTDEEQFARTSQETVDTLRQTVGVGPDDVILEIGAGVGRVGPALAAVCKRWIAADVSVNMLEHAKERLRGYENVETVVLNGWDLSPIASESIDLVYSTVVFMHLDEWERFAYICEAMRVLRPGGRVYVDNYTLLGDDGWQFFLEHFEGIHPLDRPANISKSSTPQELEVYLRRAGFVDVRGRSADMFTWAWARKPRP